MEETKKIKDMSDEELTEKLSEAKIKALAETNQFPAGHKLEQFNSVLCVACGNVLRGIREIRLGFHLQISCYKKMTK